AVSARRHGVDAGLGWRRRCRCRPRLGRGGDCDQGHCDPTADTRRRLPDADRSRGRRRAGGGERVSTVASELSDTWVLASRSVKRIARQPDLAVGFTVQPIMFVLLFVYVFGGAISTPGYSYVEYLIPGILVQSIVFGGFVTALGLSDDLKKGLMD